MIYKLQLEEYIYGISEELHNILYRDMEKQAYHIQVLLADQLSQCKGKGVIIVDKNIEKLQEVYQNIIISFLFYFKSTIYYTGHIGRPW